MKTNVRRAFLLLLAAILSLCLFALVACGETTDATGSEEEEPIEETTSYAVSVYNGREVFTLEIKEGEEIVLSAADRENEYFVGWSIEGRMTSSENPYTFRPISDVSVNAIYKQTFTIRLFAGEGEISEDTFVFVEGSSYSLPVPTYEHNVFLGWYDGAQQYTDEKGKSLAPLDTLFDLNLTAKYEPIPTFTVRANNGEEIVDHVYYQGEEVTLTAVSIANKKCDGWYAMVVETTEEGEREKEVQLTASSSYTFIVSENTSIYAKYHESYKITVDGGAGGGDFRPGEICTVTLRNSMTWRSFRYWRNYYTGEPIRDGEGQIITSETFSFEVTESLIIEAVFVKNQYTITYKVDGEVFHVETLTYNDEIPECRYIPAAHHVFSGWSAIPTKMPDRDLEVIGTTAWETHRIIVDGGTVRLKDAAGYGMSAGVFDYNSSVVITADDKTSVGKRHIGWMVGGVDFYEADESGIMTVTRDITLKPKYEDILYNLVYFVTGADYGTEGQACFDEDKYVGGSLSTRFPATLKYGESVPILDDLYRDHYDFSGWSRIPETMPAANLTIYGSFAVHIHTLRVNGGYIDGDEEVHEKQVAWGSSVTVNPVLATGYRFYTWENDRGVVYAEEGDGTYTFDMVGDPEDPSYNGYTYELTANTLLRDYYIRYYVDGEAYQTPVLSHYDYPINLKAEAKKDHYTFSGWHIIVNGQLADVPGEMPDSDLDIYGTFSINRYTLTIGTRTYYNTEWRTGYFGDDPDCYEVTLDWGSSIEIHANDLSEIGKDFSEWLSGSGNVQTTASENATFTYTIEAERNVTFNAQFTDHQYTATFYLKAPHAAEYDQVRTTTFTYTALWSSIWSNITNATHLNHTHHDWSGWYYLPDDERLGTETPVTAISSMPAHDLDFYSECAFTRHDITVGNNAVNGNVSGYIEEDPDNVTAGNYEWSEVITIAPTIPYGYDFVQWNFNGTVVPSQNINILDAETGRAEFTVRGEGTLEAIFTRHMYTVTVTDGYIVTAQGNVLSKQFAYETEINLTPRTSPEGFEFSHWELNGEYFGDDEDIVEFPVTEDCDFVLQWKNLKYEITYYCRSIQTGALEVVDFGDENYPNPQTDLIFQQRITRYPNLPDKNYNPNNVPLLTHYTFSGWKKSPDGSLGNVNAQFDMGSSDMSIYGWYTPDTHTITVVGGTGGGVYNYAQAITIQPTVPEGKHFDHWENSLGQTVSEDASYAFVVDGNETLTAVFEYNDYTVRYLVSGGTYGTDTVYATFTEQHFGSAFPTVDDPDRIELFGFAGWKYNNGALPATMPSSDVDIRGEFIDLYEYNLDGNEYRLGVNEDATGLFPALVTLPSVHAGKAITGIVADSFVGVTGVDELVIPTGYTNFATGCLNGLGAETITLSALPTNDRFYTLFGESAGSIPSTVKTIVYNGSAIPESAFASLSNLESVTISAATSIGANAFNGCSSLTELNITSTGLTSVGAGAFSGLTNLVSFYFDAASLLSVAENTFYSAGDFGTGIVMTVGTHVTVLPNNLFYVSYGTKPKVRSLIFEGTAPATVGSYAFYDQTTLVGALDLTGCSSVGQYAFYNTGLTGVTIPSTLTSIGEHAFGSMGFLATVSAAAPIGLRAFVGSGSDMAVTLTTGVTSIGAYAFMDADIGSFTFVDNGVTFIASGAFKNSTIETATLPEGLTEISTEAFYGSSLATLTLPTTLTTIGEEAFAHCDGLETVVYKAANVHDLTDSSGVFGSSGVAEGMAVTISADVAYIPSYLFYGTDVNVSKLTIVDDGALDEIGVYAFYGLSLTDGDAETVDLYLGNTVRTIGEYAFYDIGATVVVLPYRVYYMGEKAFAESSDLTIRCQVAAARTGWTTDWAENVSAVVYSYGVTTSGDYDYVVGGSRAYLSAYNGAGGAVEVPAEIDGHAIYDIGNVFSGNTDLTSVVLPVTVTEFYDDAFAGCTNLTSVSGVAGHPGVTLLAKNAFKNDEKLTTFGFTMRVTEIGESAFEGCELFDGIDLTGVLYIGNYAFRNAGLTSVTISSVLINVGEQAFFGCPIASFARSDTENESEYYEIVDGCLIDLYEDALLYYPVASAETTFATPAVSTIASYAFRNATNLASLTIAEEVVTIEPYAFVGCENLIAIVYNATEAADLTSLTHAFDGAGSSSTGVAVTIGADVLRIPAYLFYGTDVVLKSVTFLGNSVTLIGAYAFFNNQFTTVTIVSSVETLGEKSFFGSSLTSIYWNAVSVEDPEETDEIFGSTAGATVIVGSTVSRLPSNAFYSNTGVNVVAVDLTAANELIIGENAFRKTALTSLTLAAGVDDVENGAFAEIVTLVTIHLVSTENFTGNNIFAGSGSAPGGIAVYLDGANVSDNLLYATNSPVVTSVVFASAVRRVGENAFRGLTGITAVNLNEGLEIVEQYAFYGDTGVTTLTIPSTVVTIRSYAFAAMSGLTTLNYNAANAGFDYAGEETETGFGNDGNVFAIGLGAADLTVNIGDDVEVVPAFMFLSPRMEDILCERNTYETGTALGPNDTIKSCDDNPLITLKNDSGETTNLTSQKNDAQLSLVTVDELNRLAVLYQALLDNYTITDDLAEYLLTSGAIYDDFNSLFSREKILFSQYDDGMTDLMALATFTLSSGAVIGLNKPFDVTLRDYYVAVASPDVSEIGSYYEYVNDEYVLTEDLAIGNKTYYYKADYAKYRQAIMKLFGFNNSSTFTSYVNTLADFYLTNDAGATASSARGRLTYNGAILTQNGSYLLPYLFVNEGLHIAVTAVMMVGADGVVSIYVGDIAKAITLSNVYKTYAGGIETTVYGRTELFDLRIGQTRVVAVNFPTTATNLTTIGDYAFPYLTNAVFNALPESVQYVQSYAFAEDEGVQPLHLYAPREIGAFAFARSGLTTVVFDDCDEAFSIGESAFADCRRLTSVTFDADGIDLTIGAYAFKNDDLITDFSTIPDSVVSFGEGAFEGCSGLTDVNLGTVITEIPDALFKNCSSLPDITIPATVESIGASAFEYCTSLAIDLVVNVPIGERAFFRCYELTSITIGDDATSIGAYAFFDTTAVTSIVIGESVMTIGSYAFGDTFALTSITYNAVGRVDGPPISYATVGSGVFYDAGKNSGGFAITIGAKVEFVPNNLFYISTAPAKATSLSFASRGVEPTSLRIGAHAFEKLSLATVELPDFVTEVGDYAFNECKDATTLTLGSGLTTIGQRAFAEMRSVTVLNHNAANLNDNNFSSQNNPLNTNVFWDLGVDGAGVTLNVAAEVEKIHNWMFYLSGSSNYADEAPKIVTVNFAAGSQCTTIGNYAFYSNTYLTTINNPQFTVVGASAFASTAITAIPNVNNLVTIGQNAFLNCAQVETIVLSTTLTSLGISAFAGCSGVRNLVINNDSLSFDNSSWIAAGGADVGGMDVVFGQVDTVPADIFYHSSGVRPSIKSISFAQYKFVSIAKIEINDGTGKYTCYEDTVPYVLTIGDSAFYGANVTTYDFSNRSVGAVGEYAFYGETATIEMNVLNYYETDLMLAGTTGDEIHHVDETTTVIDQEIEEYHTNRLAVLSVTIADYAFYNVPNLTLHLYSRVYEDTDSPIFSKMAIGNYAFKNPSDNYNRGVSFARPASVEAPDLLEYYGTFSASLLLSVGEEAFFGCGRINGGETFDGNFSAEIQGGVGAFAFAHTKIDNISIGTSEKGLYLQGPFELGESAFLDTNWYNGTSDGFVYIPAYITDNDVTTLNNRYLLYAYKGDMAAHTELTIPTGTTFIGPKAFYGLTNLETLHLTDSILWLGDGAFGNTIIRHIDGPLTVAMAAANGDVGLMSIKITSIDTEFDDDKKIGERAFNACNLLEEVVLCDGILYIAMEAFRNCTALARLVIPDSVELVADNAFTGVTNLRELSAPLSIVTTLAANNKNLVIVNVTSVSTGATTIAANMFQNVTTLQMVTLCSGITSIGSSAFYGCTTLSWINIPSTITSSNSIGNNAFRYCYRLAEVRNDSSLNITKTNNSSTSTYGRIGYFAQYIYKPASGSSRITVDENGFILYTENTTVTLVGYLGTETTLTLPNVNKIYKYAFWGMSDITTITVPNTVTNIGEKAFYVDNRVANGLTLRVGFKSTSGSSSTYPGTSTSVSLGSNWKDTGVYVVYATTVDANGFILKTNNTTVTLVGYEGSETTLTLPEVDIIGENAFYGRSEITSITIPNTVTEIEAGAFWVDNRVPHGLTLEVGFTSEGVYPGDAGVVTLNANWKDDNVDVIYAE